MQKGANQIFETQKKPKTRDYQVLIGRGNWAMFEILDGGYEKNSRFYLKIALRIRP